jgi:hypothetical protein
LLDKFKAQEKKDRKKSDAAEDKKSEEPGGVE